MTIDPGMLDRLGERIADLDLEVFLPWLKRPVSGTYRNPTPAVGGSILELRVDVDGRRPQERLSGRSVHPVLLLRHTDHLLQRLVRCRRGHRDRR